MLKTLFLKRLRVLCASRCEHFMKCLISGGLNLSLMEKSVYTPPLEAGVLWHLIKFREMFKFP